MAQWPTTATGQQTAPSYTTVAAYDDAGEPTTLSYPDGELATTSYTQGYFAGLSWHQGLGIGYAFDTLVGAVSYSGTGGAYGGITSATIGSVSGNALYSYTASYDTLGRAAETTIGKVGGGGSTLFDEQLSYDPDGNVAAVSTTGDGHHFRQQHDHDQLLLRRRQADRRDRQRGAVERKQHEAEALEASEQRLAQHPDSASRLSIPTTCRHGKTMEPPRSGAAYSGHWLSQPSGSSAAWNWNCWLPIAKPLRSLNCVGARNGVGSAIASIRSLASWSITVRSSGCGQGICGICGICPTDCRPMPPNAA